MSNDQIEYKVQILEKNKDLFTDISEFLFRNSTNLKRDFFLNEILNEQKFDLNQFQKNSPIKVENVFGSTFQSSFRKNEDIYAISHHIDKIGYDGINFYCILYPSKYIEPIDFNKVILRPVWFKNEKDEYLLATFDIDFNITDKVT